MKLFRRLRKLSYRKQVTIVLFLTVVLVSAGVFIWAVFSGNIKPFAQTTCPANSICNTASVTYNGITVPIESNTVITNIVTGTNINLALTLQGNAGSDSSSSNVHLIIYPAGQITPVFEKSDLAIGPTGSGQVTADLTDGNYDFWLKVPYHLAQERTNIVLTNPLSIDFGQQRAGDIYDDNQINLSDVQIILTSWRLLSTDVGFRADADVNKDLEVSLSDVQLLITNWRVIGAQRR